MNNNDKFKEILVMAWGGKHTTHDLAKLLLELPPASLNASRISPLTSKSDPLFGLREFPNAWIYVGLDTDGKS